MSDTTVGYQLRYLPIFYDDLSEKVTYISEVLNNIEAANDLIDAVEKAILARVPVAESFEKYHTTKERPYPYYRIHVGNFVVYYVVICDDKGSKIMEVRRFLYNRQNRSDYL